MLAFFSWLFYNNISLYLLEYFFFLLVCITLIKVPFHLSLVFSSNFYSTFLIITIMRFIPKYDAFVTYYSFTKFCSMPINDRLPIINGSDFVDCRIILVKHITIHYLMSNFITRKIITRKSFVLKWVQSPWWRNIFNTLSTFCICYSHDFL